jgi:hypothetical protein
MESECTVHSPFRNKGALIMESLKKIVTFRNYEISINRCFDGSDAIWVKRGDRIVHKDDESYKTSALSLMASLDNNPHSKAIIISDHIPDKKLKQKDKIFYNSGSGIMRHPRNGYWGHFQEIVNKMTEGQYLIIGVFQKGLK